jgi:hypothetical protein
MLGLCGNERKIAKRADDELLDALLRRLEDGDQTGKNALLHHPNLIFRIYGQIPQDHHRLFKNFERRRPHQRNKPRKRTFLNNSHFVLVVL